MSNDETRVTVFPAEPLPTVTPAEDPAPIVIVGNSPPGSITAAITGLSALSADVGAKSAAAEQALAVAQAEADRLLGLRDRLDAAKAKIEEGVTEVLAIRKEMGL